MTYDSRSRDRYRLAVTVTTATLAAGAIAATGWVAGAAAHEQAQADAEKQAKQDALARQNYDTWAARYVDQDQDHQPRTALLQRPTKTRVTTRYVTAGTAAASVGPGGTVSSGSTPIPPRPAGNPVAAPQPPPPPPPLAPPAPPPAPSNGS